MPRVQDYAKTSSHKEITVDDPRYGMSELTIEQMSAENEIAFMPRNFQFSTTWKNPIDQFQKEMDAAFDWLSENTTGPWFWDEDWTNNFHTLFIGLHIERICDQALFHKTWGHAFEYLPDKDYELEKLAVVKGVLPANPSIFLWLGKHDLRHDSNYFEPGFEGEAGRRILIAAKTVEEVELLQSHWGHLFKPFIPEKTR